MALQNLYHDAVWVTLKLIRAGDKCTLGANLTISSYSFQLVVTESNIQLICSGSGFKYFTASIAVDLCLHIIASDAPYVTDRNICDMVGKTAIFELL